MTVRLFSFFAYAFLVSYKSLYPQVGNEDHAEEVKPHFYGSWFIHNPPHPPEGAEHAQQAHKCIDIPLDGGLQSKPTQSAEKGHTVLFITKGDVIILYI